MPIAMPHPVPAEEARPAPGQLFEHHCPHCVPLGQFEHFDLYHCTRQNGHPTILARFGHGPADYVSGIFAARKHPALNEALLRAMARGLPVYSW